MGPIEIIDQPANGIIKVELDNKAIDEEISWDSFLNPFGVVIVERASVDHSNRADIKSCRPPSMQIVFKY